MTVPVGILGGGGFGRGLAKTAARLGRPVVLWSRSGKADLGEQVRVTDDLSELARAELIYVAVPSQHVAELARDLGRHLDGSHLMVHVSRGLVGEDLTTVSHVMRTETPVRRVGVLGGPLVADAIAAGTPGGGIVGTCFPEVVGAVRETIGGPTLRIYSTDDVNGVEVASAMVGLLVLGIGFVRQLGMGPGALAVMGTRGMVEAARLGRALDGREQTFGGLAGFGDLLAALAGDERPEIRLGQALATGDSLADAAEKAGAHIEGVSFARRVTRYAARMGVEVPISQALADVLDGRLTPEQALESLMTRRVGHE